MAKTLAELVRLTGGELRGKQGHVVQGVSTLLAAGPDDVAFLADEHYLPQLKRCRAGVVILDPAHASACKGNAILTDNPHLVFARIAHALYPVDTPPPGIHQTAVVHESARISRSASVAAHCVIGADSTVAAHASLGPHCVLGENVHVGENTRLVAHVAMLDRCKIGKRGLVHPGVVIGADGFGFARDGARWVKVPQLGCVVIGDDVEIGANSAIDRGALSDTVIGDGVKLDNLIQVAHNVQIGANTAVAGQAGIAGSAIIGERCTVGGQAVILGHLELVDDVHITATSLVTKSINEPGAYSSSLKAMPVAGWRRNVARLHQIEALARRVAELEERIRKLAGEESV